MTTAHNDRMFYFVAPCGQWMLDGDLKEYHIHTHLECSFMESFHGHKGCCFHDEITEFLTKSFECELKCIGYDSTNCEEGHTAYIWVQIHKSNDIIRDIIDSLNNKYYSEWVTYRVPKLLTILKTCIKDDAKFLAQSVSHHQKLNGFQTTQDVLHVLFEHII